MLTKDLDLRITLVVMLHLSIGLGQALFTQTARGGRDNRFLLTFQATETL
jgi:hypothetical protein